MSEIYYFGCIREAGHYWFQSIDRKARTISFNVIKDMVPGLRAGIDGTFIPPNEFKPQEAMCCQVGRWFILCWKDNSVDTRGGSHSCLIGTCDNFYNLLQMGKLAFPEVFERQPPITIKAQ